MVPPAVKLEVRNVEKRFGGAVALSDVSLQVRAGEIHAICGENGAGKSTLMKILAGAITDYTGELLLDGVPVRFAEPRDAEEAGVSIIHQELNLVPQLSAAANLFLGKEIASFGCLLSNRKMERAAADLFKRFDARIDPRAKVGDLRIGDQQLVEIAKALSLDSDVVIMDEPTSALSEAETQRLFRVIEDLKARGVSVLYISHKMDEVFRLADRITVLRDGRVVGTAERREISPRDVVRMMVGREWQTNLHESTSPSAKELLRVERLCLPHRSRHGRMQLSDVSFSLREGEVLGVAGLLGAGRTELLECLFGANRMPIASGEILLHGERVRFRQPSDAVDRGVAMLTEDRKTLGLFADLSVRTNITLSVLDRLQRFGFVRNRQERLSTREMIEALAIKSPGAESAVRRLSGGNQQKCILARWLLTQPRFLLLDEPTRGVDVGAKQEIHRHLRRLAADGMGIVMTSSELPELLSACDRILVLCEGRVAGEFAAAEATEEMLLHAAMSSYMAAG